MRSRITDGKVQQGFSSAWTLATATGAFAMRTTEESLFVRVTQIQTRIHVAAQAVRKLVDRYLNATQILRERSKASTAQDACREPEASSSTILVGQRHRQSIQALACAPDRQMGFTLTCCTELLDLLRDSAESGLLGVARLLIKIQAISVAKQAQPPARTRTRRRAVLANRTKSFLRDFF